MSQRIQTKYGSAGLFVGPSPATGQHFAGGNDGVNLVEQITRVQSFSDTWDNPLENVNQFGQTAAIDKVATTSPTPTFDFEYFLTNGVNEKGLGFPIDGSTSAISGFLEETTSSKNYFALFVPEGVDAVANTNRASHFVVGLGNGYINNWSANLSVGDFARATCSVEGSNYVVHVDSSGNSIPAINPADGSEITAWQYAIPLQTTGVAGQPTVIRQGQIIVEALPGDDLFGVKLNTAHLQSAEITIPLAREALERLGNQFVFARPLETPIDATVSLDFNVSELSTGSLAAIFNNCQSNRYDFRVRLKGCVGNTESDQMLFTIKGAFVESEDNSLDVGTARAGSIQFTVPLGGALDTDNGVFISGAYTG